MDYDMSAGGVLMPAAEPKSLIAVHGHYHGKILRVNGDVEEFDCPNLCVDEGLNSLLNIEFDAATQITAWYMGLFEGNYTPVAGVTGATIASASTESTAYNETTRRSFTPAAASAKSISNSASAATFTFNAAKTIYGAFLISDSTKGGTAGTLFSAARFASSKSVGIGDQLLLTYTFTASSV